MNISELFSRIVKDQPIAYHPDFAKAIGSVGAALLLSLLLEEHSGKWVCKTQKEIFDETGLTRREQETARRKLRILGILEETYQGIPRKLYFKVNLEKLYRLLVNFYKKSVQEEQNASSN